MAHQDYENENPAGQPSSGAEGADFFSTGGGPQPEPGVVLRPGPQHLAVGSLIRDRFRVEGLLGEGGMGVVYLVHDQMLGQRKAMKLLHPGLDQSWRDQLVEELRLQQQLSHEGILRSYSLDVDPTLGQTFFTMEYVEGPSLEQRLQEASQAQQRPPFSLNEISEFLAHLTDALSYAHGKQIVHRDLKPSNILLPEGGGIKLLDFGIARQVSEGAQHTGLVGTAIYMAPEQLRGGDAISAAADVYSVGVILYQMMTGELFYGRMPGPTELLETYGVTGVFPEALDDVILTSLEAIPRRRFSTIDELCDAFEEACQGNGPSSKSRPSRAKKQFWKQPPPAVEPPEPQAPEAPQPAQSPRPEQASTFRSMGASVSDAIPYYEPSEHTPKVGKWKAAGWGCVASLGAAMMMTMVFSIFIEGIFSSYRYRPGRYAWLAIPMAVACGLLGAWLASRMASFLEERFSWEVRGILLAGWFGGMISFSTGIGVKGAPGGMALLGGLLAVFFWRGNWARFFGPLRAWKWVGFGFLVALVAVAAEDGRLLLTSLIAGPLAGLLINRKAERLLAPPAAEEVALEEI